MWIHWQTIFMDINNFITDNGIKNMIKDQFHFTTFGKKYISQQIYNFINKQ